MTTTLVAARRQLRRPTARRLRAVITSGTPASTTAPRAPAATARRWVSDVGEADIGTGAMAAGRRR